MHGPFAVYIHYPREADVSCTFQGELSRDFDDEYVNDS